MLQKESSDIFLHVCYVLTILYTRKSFGNSQNCLNASDISKIFNLIEKYSAKYKICRVRCTIEIIEFSQEEIQRMSQTHEDIQTKKSCIFLGNFFIARKNLRPRQHGKH